MPATATQIVAMNVEEMTFGIELEITIPAGTIEAGAYHYGRPIPGFPEGWNAQRDGSLSATIPGHVGIEIVSPKLSGAAGLLQVAEVVAKLNAMGARVNRTCGFHVHVGFPTQYLPRLGNLAYLTANLERALFASTGTKNRERNNYCRTIKQSPLKDANYDAAAAANSPRVLQSSINQRYHTLNLTNLVDGRRPAVEFRVFQGTLNLQKIVGYIRMCLGIVQKAMDSRRRVEWDAKGRGGIGGDAGVPLTGKEELQRAFYRLGWNRGSTAKVYGDLQAEGIGGIEESKAILSKMAAKYDEAN